MCLFLLFVLSSNILCSLVEMCNCTFLTLLSVGMKSSACQAQNCTFVSLFLAYFTLQPTIFPT